MVERDVFNEHIRKIRRVIQSERTTRGIKSGSKNKSCEGYPDIDDLTCGAYICSLMDDFLCTPYINTAVGQIYGGHAAVGSEESVGSKSMIIDERLEGFPEFISRLIMSWCYDYNFGEWWPKEGVKEEKSGETIHLRCVDDLYDYIYSLQD